VAGYRILEKAGAVPQSKEYKDQDEEEDKSQRGEKPKKAICLCSSHKKSSFLMSLRFGMIAFVALVKYYVKNTLGVHSDDKK